MADLPPCDRLASARARALARTTRARASAILLVAAVAWWAHPAAAVQANEQLPLGGASERATATAATASESAGSWAETARAAGALAAVLALIGGGWWWLRRSGLGPDSHGGAFEILSRHPIGKGQHVVVARFGPRVLCLQQTREGMRTLSELSSAEEAADALQQSRGASLRVGSPLRMGKHLRTVDVRGKGAA